MATVKNHLERVSIIIAIIGGLGGLVTGTVSLAITYRTYSQSLEAEAKLYANKVITTSYKGGTYIQNYSALPIIEVEAVAEDMNLPLDRRDPGEIVLRLGTIPPCTQVNVTDWVQEATNRRNKTTAILVRFSDINAVRWARAAAGAPVPITSALNGYSTDSDGPPTEPLPECA